MPGNRRSGICTVRDEKERDQRLRTRSVLRAKWSIEDVFKRVPAAEGIAPEALKKRSRMSIASASRKRGAYICCRVLGYRIEAVVAYVHISGAAVSLANG